MLDFLDQLRHAYHRHQFRRKLKKLDWKIRDIREASLAADAKLNIEASLNKEKERTGRDHSRT